MALTPAIELTAIGVSGANEIERDIAALARSAGSGLIIVGPPSSIAHHRNLIIGLANRLRLPAVYPTRFFVADGGLLSYGPDLSDQYRRAAVYVDRILKGEKPADLQDCQSTRPHNSALPARSRRRGDRMRRREFVSLLGSAVV